MYAIIRVSKIKDNIQLAKAVGHNLRTIPTANADPNIENKIIYGKNLASVIGNLEKRIIETGNEKHRKDAVKAVEFVLTASPEFFANNTTNHIENWVSENIEFLKSEIGKDNILQIALHLDESTPHLHVIATPITSDNRLSCKDFYGGRSKLVELQNRYAKSMAKFGLMRGEQREKTQRKTIKEYYELINRLAKLNKLQLKKLSDIIDADCDQDTFKLLKELNYQQAKEIPKPPKRKR